jgi:hypothetical protein
VELPGVVMDVASELLADLPPDLAMQLLERSTMRTGRGGRQRAQDARLDVSIDPKRAARIQANREAAARSKLKAKLAREVRMPSAHLALQAQFPTTVYAVIIG